MKPANMIRFWPQTLLWRTFFLITLLLGLSLLAWHQIYSHYALRPRALQTAQMVTSVVNLTRAALLASDATQRMALLAELNTQESIRIFPAEEEDATERLPDESNIQLLMSRVRERLGLYTRFASKLNGNSGFFVSFRADESDPDDEYWLMLPAERIGRLAPAEWFAWGVGAAFVSLLCAYLLVLGIARPLKVFEKAAQAVARGESHDRLPEHGAREIVALSRAFNEMSIALAQLESDRALILAGISHDLKTPLTRLRLGIEMSGANDADMANMVCDIEDMDRIVRQFIDFARDVQNEAEQECNLGALLTESVQPYAKRGVMLTQEIPVNVPARVRPQSIRRAITNLIDNALRYGPPQGPVEISLKPTTRNMVMIEIRDHGPGIPADQVERLKRPFTRLETARSNAEGSGLGLAIVERIARFHRGSLDLLNHPDGGIRAILTLGWQN